MNEPTVISEDHLSVTQASRLVKVDRSTVDGWIRDGIAGGVKLPATWIGCRRFVLKADLTAFLLKINCLLRASEET